MEAEHAIDVETLKRDWIAGISGSEFWALVSQQVASFSATDGAADRGVLLAESDPVRFAASFFAGLSLGMPMILANPQWGSHEWDEFADLVNPAFIVGQAPLTTEEREGGKNPRPGEILIPTGGTTGGVKLAIHDWNSLLAASHALADFLGGGPIHSCCLLPLYHVSGLLQLVRSFATGGQIRFSDALAEGDCVSLVPTQLQRILDDPAGVERLRVARAVFIGGAAIPEAVATRASELRLPLVPVYGMTETAAMVAAVSTDDFLKGNNAGARPLGRARIGLDPDGGIRIWTPALFKGYHGREALDLSKGFRTGDRGYFDDQGGLHVLGRMDDLINTGGEKVDPAEVECALLRMDGIEAAHVTGEPDAEWGQVVVAYLEGNRSIDSEALRQKLKADLSPFKIPKRFEWVDTIGACQV